MNRRAFLREFSNILYAITALPGLGNWFAELKGINDPNPSQLNSHQKGDTNLQSDDVKLTAEDKLEGLNTVTVFLCGDVMTGRGIDQILPHPSLPHIYESYMKSAEGYVELAERKYGPLPRSVDYSYIWGDVLEDLDKLSIDARIINLETAVTQSEDAWPRKGINYRMHPKNIDCITAARIDCCTLANNHVLDWGYAGLDETLRTLHQAKVQTAGAGTNTEDAEQPAIVPIPKKGRVLIYSYGSPTSGIPHSWSVSKCRAGVNFINTLSIRNAERIAETIQLTKQAGDLVVFSIHWGHNWGYDIASEQIEFAHWLIDFAGVDIIHGHSSHHPKAVEVYKSKPIIYGCGDFINDYEGIRGHEQYRSELGFMYIVRVDAVSGNLISFELKPTRIKRFRVNRASDQEVEWLYRRMKVEYEKLATAIDLHADNTFKVYRK